MKQFATDQFRGGKNKDVFAKKSDKNFDMGFVKSEGGGGDVELVDITIDGYIDKSDLKMLLTASGTSFQQTGQNPDPEDPSTMIFREAATTALYTVTSADTVGMDGFDTVKALPIDAENGIYKVIYTNSGDTEPALVITPALSIFVTLLGETAADNEAVELSEVYLRISDIILMDSGENDQYISFCVEPTMNYAQSANYSDAYPVFNASNQNGDQTPFRFIAPIDFTIVTE